MSNDPKAKPAAPTEKPTSGKVLKSLMGPKDLDTPEKRKAYAKTLGTQMARAAQDLRKAFGLPPWPDDPTNDPPKDKE
jgi:hypothetical protein